MLVTNVILKYALFYDMLNVPGFYFQSQEIKIIICMERNYVKMMNKLSSPTRLSFGQTRIFSRAGEVTQCLRAWAALPEAQGLTPEYKGLIPSTHMVTHNCL